MKIKLLKLELIYWFFLLLGIFTCRLALNQYYEFTFSVLFAMSGGGLIGIFIAKIITTFFNY